MHKEKKNKNKNNRTSSLFFLWGKLFFKSQALKKFQQNQFWSQQKSKSWRVFSASLRPQFRASLSAVPTAK